RPPPTPTLFPYTTLFRSDLALRARTRERLEREIHALRALPHRSHRRLLRARRNRRGAAGDEGLGCAPHHRARGIRRPAARGSVRSEEHTSELQSPYDLVC